MALIGDIAIGLSVSTAAFKAGLKTAEGAVDRFKGALGGLGSALTSTQGLLAGLGIGIAIHKAVGLIGDVVNAGAELNAAMSKTRVILGDAAEAVFADAQKMADGAGIIKTDFIDAAASFGAVFKQIGKSREEAASMGIQLTRLGIDMASLEGGTVQAKQAFVALQSAFRGEFDPIERFRVFLTADKVAAEALALGLAKTKAEITDLAKKTATLSLIYKQTTDAQGDLDRTLGDVDNQAKGLAGRMVNLEADTGMALQGMTTAVYTLAGAVAKDLTEAFNRNKDAMKAWGDEAGASGGLVFDAFRKLGHGVGIVADVVHYTRLGFKALGVIGVESAAIITNAYVMALDAFNKVQARLLGGNLPPGAAGEAAQAHAFADALNQQAKAAFDEFDRMNKAGAPGAGIAARFDAIAAGGQKAAAGMGAVAKGAEQMVAPMKTAVDKVAEMTQKLQEQLFLFGKSPGVVAAYRALMAGATQAQADQIGNLADQLDAMEKGAKGKEGPTHAAALMAGSVEARSAVLKFQGMGAGEEPIKQVAKTNVQQVDLQKQMVAGINKLVEKAGTALGDAFAGLMGA